MSAQAHGGFAQSSKAISRNVAGQRLGRKGQETRERILVAALRLFDDPEGPPVTLTHIAREADVRLTNLYLYFPDFEELLLALLNRVMQAAETAYLHRLRTRWPDDGLSQCCAAFLWDHCNFWRRYARLLHLRNSVADTTMRLRQHRNQVSRPIIDLLVFQMKGDGPERIEHVGTAMVLLVAFERVATVVTGQHFDGTMPEGGLSNDDDLIALLIGAEARLLELAIRDQRTLSQKSTVASAFR